MRHRLAAAFIATLLIATPALGQVRIGLMPEVTGVTISSVRPFASRRSTFFALPGAGVSGGRSGGTIDAS